MDIATLLVSTVPSDVLVLASGGGVAVTTSSSSSTHAFRVTLYMRMHSKVLYLEAHSWFGKCSRMGAGRGHPAVYIQKKHLCLVGHPTH